MRLTVDWELKARWSIARLLSIVLPHGALGYLVLAARIRFIPLFCLFVFLYEAFAGVDPAVRVLRTRE